jgi:hypothetical protein
MANLWPKEVSQLDLPVGNQGKNGPSRILLLYFWEIPIKIQKNWRPIKKMLIHLCEIHDRIKDSVSQTSQRNTIEENISVLR